MPLSDEDFDPMNLELFQQEKATRSILPSGDDGSTTSPSVTPSLIVPQPKRKAKLTATDEVILEYAGEHLKVNRPDDEFEAYGKYICHKLRSLKVKQAIFARKLINDVIFEAELEALNKGFNVMNCQSYRSFENNVMQQFNPTLYPHQPYTPLSTPPSFRSTPNHRSSNNVQPNS